MMISPVAVMAEKGDPGIVGEELPAIASVNVSVFHMNTVPSAGVGESKTMLFAESGKRSNWIVPDEVGRGRGPKGCAGMRERIPGGPMTLPDSSLTTSCSVRV